ncbi:ATP-binding protein [Desulfococcaceae bacterium HSG9]|nr:ATP-binding protein [Desulfococcaceae bacterium HSG9]
MLLQSCKAGGHEIYNHFSTLQRELKRIIILFDLKYLKEKDFTDFQQEYINKELSQYFKSLIIMNGNQYIPILDDIENLPDFSSIERKHINSGQTLLFKRQRNDISADIFLARLYDHQKPAEGIIVAEVNPDYFWSFIKDDALPADVEIVVINQKQECLVSSSPNLNSYKTYLKAFQQASATGNFQISYQKEEYIASYWSVYIERRFLTPNWIIIFSKSKTDVMAPVSQFKIIFFLLLLLTFWIVAYLSISLIRKSLIPIETLRQGTQRIAEGDFGYTLEIDSDDEFETLGHSFNEMSLKLKKSQEMLVQSAKMGTFGQMAAGIVHEIGQPLSSIMGFADILLMSKPSAKQKKYLEIVRRELNRLAAIVARFRSYSQASSETMQSLAINRIIDDTYTLLEHQVCNKGIEFNVAKASDMPNIAGDEDSLKQVILNLVINARDALEERPDHRQFINIKTESDATCVYVKIEDNGSGMSPEIQQQIFDPFFTTKSKDKGTGLGLAIIDSILHKHKAQIRLESKEGVGTRFTISFPTIKDA